jgi:hypothetical protein
MHFKTWFESDVSTVNGKPLIVGEEYSVKSFPYPMKLISMFPSGDTIMCKMKYGNTTLNVSVDELS